jgi:hypothetical protein
MLLLLFCCFSFLFVIIVVDPPFRLVVNEFKTGARFRHTRLGHDVRICGSCP